MTAHAVVFLDYPPAVLNVLPPLIRGHVEERLRHVRAFRSHAAEQQRRQTRAPLLSQKRFRHAQSILRLEILRFAAIVNRRIGELVLKEATMVVPFCFFIFWMKLQRIAPVLGVLSQQSEIETFERRRAFSRQLLADALLIFEALDFMATGTAVL